MPRTTPPLLATFRHPAVIAAILLLLLNDHVLKAAVPSWITGKLSDFAGLFFFPLLLGALIELAAACFKRKAPLALPLALAFTGLLFAAIKTVPAANALYTSAMGVQVIRDPSDLIALVMLLPAWWMGNQLGGYTKRVPGRTAYAVLTLGALASMATSPCMPGPAIERVLPVDGNLYAGGNRFPGGSYSTQYLIVFHYDAGEDAWQPQETPAPEIASAFEVPPPALPYTLCDPANAQICYRIDGTARVEESTDGGQTWRTAWSIPPERRSFMQRVPLLQNMYCGKKVEFRTYDLTMLPGGPVVVAAGSEGLVIRDASGEWHRVGIGDYVQPTPIRARNLSETLEAIQPEFIYAGVLSLLAYTVLSVWARQKNPKPDWALHPGVFVLPWLLAILSVIITAGESDGTIPMLTPLIAFFAFAALIIMLTVMGLIILTVSVANREYGDVWAYLAVFSALALPTLIFILWAYGIIPPYWLAAALAVILTTAVVTLLVRQWRRAAPSE